ncbi:cell division protein FtsB [bacterium]|nr:cell division protein FtsB [bacterium]
MSRWIALSLLVLLAALQLELWVAGGMREVWRLEAALSVQMERVAESQQRNQQLNAEVMDLKTGQEAIEERARAELGMVGTGETFYQVIETPAQSDGSRKDVANYFAQ